MTNPSRRPRAFSGPANTRGYNKNAMSKPESQDNPIFTSEQRARFRQLQNAQDAGAVLTPDEQAELAALFQHIEDAEAVYLRPATERLRREAAEKEARNRALEALVRRKEVMIKRLEAVLSELEAERRAIDDEVRHLLGDSEPREATIVVASRAAP